MKHHPRRMRRTATLLVPSSRIGGLVGLVGLACAPASSPKPGASATPAPMPAPSDIKGPLAGTVPGADGAPLVRIIASERYESGATSLESVFVGGARVRCADLLGSTERPVGVRLNPRRISELHGAGETTPLWGGFATSPAREGWTDAEGFIVLDAIDQTPGGAVSGTLYARGNTGAPEIAGHFDGSVCMHSFTYQALSTVNLMIDGQSIPMKYAYARTESGSFDITLASAMKTPTKPADDAWVIDLREPVTPNGRFFDGVALGVGVVELRGGPSDADIHLDGSVTIPPIKLAEFAHLRGTVDMHQAKVDPKQGAKKHDVNVEGTFDVRLGDDHEGVFEWLAEKSMTSGPATFTAHGKTRTAKSARVATVFQEARWDDVDLVEGEDPCAPGAVVLASFSVRGASEASGKPTPVVVNGLARAGGNLFGWVSISSSPTVHGWVFARSTFTEETLAKRDTSIEAALLSGEFSAKACPKLAPTTAVHGIPK